MRYYPFDASLPPKVGEYAYYSKKIQDFSSDLFYCVRPRWICKIKGHRDKEFFVHFSSKYIISDYYDCVFVGKCTKVNEKLDLIALKKNL